MKAQNLAAAAARLKNHAELREQLAALDRIDCGDSVKFIASAMVNGRSQSVSVDIRAPNHKSLEPEGEAIVSTIKWMLKRRIRAVEAKLHGLGVEL